MDVIDKGIFLTAVNYSPLAMLYIKRECGIAKRLLFFDYYRLTLHKIYVPVIGIYILDFAIEYVIRLKY